MSFPSGTVAMLDVDWLTPAKRRQLTVLGEEGMFELDYLTQRLTFARATDTTEPAADRRLRADVRGRRRRAARRDRRAARRRARGVRAGRPRRRPAGRRRRGRPLGRRPRRRAADAPPASAGRSELVPAREPDRPDAPSPPSTCSAARSSCRPTRAGTRRRAAVAPWTGEPGTAGTVAVVGAGKMGLPLAAQFASHGWSVIAVDIDPAVVAAINEGRSHVGEEPGLAELVADAHAAGRLRATHRRRRGGARGGRRRRSSCPVMLDAASPPGPPLDGRGGRRDRARAPRRARRSSSRRRCRSATRASRYAPRLAEASGLTLEERPVRRVLARAPVQRGRAPQPRHLPEARRRARAGLDRPGRGVLRRRARRRRRGDVVGRGGRVRQARRHDLPRRQHRAGQRVRRATPTGSASTSARSSRRPTASRTATSTSRGSGVGGHCIPVYPHFLLDRAPELELVALARAGQRRPGRRGHRRARPTRSARSTAGRVLVLGLTYRDGVKELAYSRALPLIERPGGPRRAGRSPTTRC